MRDGIVRRGWNFALIVAACLTACAAVATAQEAAKPRPADVKAANKARKAEAEARRKAREKAQAAKARPVALPKRPARTVVPPTITAAEIDDLVDARLAKDHPDVKPAPATTDAEFVRRVYLDVAGVPPTPGQFRAFLTDKAKDKRARLIDELLASPDYGRNQARYWREVIQFRASNSNQAQVRYDVLEKWLAREFDRDRPWDEIAAAMIRGQGRTDEDGAANFAAAHAASPVQLAGEASRVFLGVQIQCAECHDHKTDSWKREQFHELAAFFAGGRMKRVMKPEPGVRAVFEVSETPRARYAMPDLAHPPKTIPTKPRFFLASQTTEPVPAGLSVAQLRELAASYITGQDDPWFARAFVNRIWTVLMGEGFYEMVDDIGPEREAVGEEVLFPLADQWSAGGFDVRWLFRTLLNTKAYQRQTRAFSTPAGATPMAAVCPSRLRADQIFENLAAALDLPRDGSAAATPAAAGKKVVKTSAGNAKNAKKAAAKKPKRQPPNLRQPFGKMFGVDPSLSPDDVPGTIPQALFLMNGAIVDARVKARPDTPLGRILAEAPDDAAALNRIYLLVLSRRPAPKEREVLADYLANAGDRKEAFEDVYWSLINSTEFLSRR